MLNEPLKTSSSPVTWLRRKFGESSVDGVFLRGASGSLAVKVGAAVAGIGAQLVLAQLLGPEVFGDYVFVLSWVMLLLIFGIVGMDKAAVRFVAGYHGQSEFGKLRGFLRRSNQVVVLASLLTGASLALVSWLLSSSMSSSLLHTFLLGSLLLPMIALLQMHAFQLRGLKKIVQGEGPVNVGRPLLVAAAALLLLATGSRLTAIHVMSANCVVTLLLLLLTKFFVTRAVPRTSDDTKTEFDTFTWLGVAASMLFLSGLVHLHARIDVLMIGMFVSTTDAGVYKIVADLAGLVAFGSVTVNVIAGPMISELHSQKRSAELQRAVSLAALGGFAIALVTIPLLWFCGKWILGFFGAEFTRAYPALVIICLGQLANLLTGPAGLILTMTGHQRQAVAIVTVSVVLNVMLNVILIPGFGLLGAATATAVTVTLQNASMFVCARKQLKLDALLLPTIAVPRVNSL